VLVAINRWMGIDDQWGIFHGIIDFNRIFVTFSERFSL